MNTEEMRDKLKDDYQQAQADWQAMKDSYEARLQGIADAQLALAKLDADNMYDRLYNDYVAIREEWRLHLADLDRQLTALAEAKRETAELKDNLKIMEYMATSAQTNKEGHINGSNEAKRKLQTALYLADLAKTDPEYKALLKARFDNELTVDDLEISVERLKGTISYLRNSARLAAGLAYALAG